MRDKSKSLVKEKSLRSFLLRLSPTFVMQSVQSVLSTLVPCFSDVDLLTYFRVYMYIQDWRFTTDATGQQEMLPSPRHLNPSLVFPGVCVCSVLNFVLFVGIWDWTLKLCTEPSPLFRKSFLLNTGKHPRTFPILCRLYLWRFFALHWTYPILLYSFLAISKTFENIFYSSLTKAKNLPYSVLAISKNIPYTVLMISFLLYTSHKM